jgi:hypothetical protein
MEAASTILHAVKQPRWSEMRMDAMVTLGMNGPYVLEDREVSRQVNRTSPGNYGLGYIKEDGSFVVQFVGRSDYDVNNRLQSWVSSGYKYFKYSYASHAKAAFDKECCTYHDFGANEKLDNKSHPERAAGTRWKCPVCGK